MVLAKRNNFNNLVNSFWSDDFFDDLFNFSREKFGIDKYPFTNISTTKDGKLEFEFALAGYSKEDIRLSVEDNVLVVSGKKEDTNEEKKWISKQIAYRDFSVKYLLPNDIDLNSVEATFKDGILKVVMNRKESRSLKIIDLK